MRISWIDHADPLMKANNKVAYAPTTGLRQREREGEREVSTDVHIALQRDTYLVFAEVMRFNACSLGVGDLAKVIERADRDAIDELAIAGNAQQARLITAVPLEYYQPV